MGRPAIVTTEPVAMDEPELLARVFRTLGDATRLRLVEVLLDVGDATQSQLVERLGATQSRVSEHLGCLVWCGFVTSRRVGRSTHYTVSDERAAALIETARRFLRDNDQAVGSCTTLKGDDAETDDRPTT